MAITQTTTNANNNSHHEKFNYEFSISTSKISLQMWRNVVSTYILRLIDVLNPVRSLESYSINILWHLGNHQPSTRTTRFFGVVFLGEWSRALDEVDLNDVFLKKTDVIDEFNSRQMIFAFNWFDWNLIRYKIGCSSFECLYRIWSVFLRMKSFFAINWLEWIFVSRILTELIKV